MTDRGNPHGSTATELALVETECIFCHSRTGAVEATGYDFEYDTARNAFRFLRCDGCGHVYLNPRPAAADLGVIYPQNYYTFVDMGGLVTRLRRTWEGRKVRVYSATLGPGKKKILDVGCGDGRFLGVLRDFGSPSWELSGVEFDEVAVERCRARGFEVFRGRVEDMAEMEGTFDCVIMLQLIEHVEDPSVIARRVFSLLRPGGVFVVETPNLAGLDYALFRGRVWGHYHFPRHFHLFSHASLAKMMTAAGFTVDRTDRLISTSAWTISLGNYFLDRRYPAWFTRFFNYKNPLLLAIFVVLDTIRSKLGLETSNQRIVARKP